MSNLNLERAQIILAIWKEGFLTSVDVVEWADRKIAGAKDGEELPDWLLDLSLHGPNFCWLLPEAEFLPRTRLDFSTNFACRVSQLDLANDSQLERFAGWIAWASLGENLATPEVKLGYQVDELLYHCDQQDLALELLRAELPAFRLKCREVAANALDLSY